MVSLGTRLGQSLMKHGENDTNVKKLNEVFLRHIDIMNILSGHKHGETR